MTPPQKSSTLEETARIAAARPELLARLARREFVGERRYRCWVCPDCGHWTGSSYMQPTEDNPDWRPRCKMKGVECSRPGMEPLILKQEDAP